MPWSPIPKFPEIIRDLKTNEFAEQVSLEPLKNSIMRITGIIRPDALKRVIQAMESLGYLKRHELGDVWFIHKEKLYKFSQDKEEEEKMDNLLNSSEDK